MCIVLLLIIFTTVVFGAFEQMPRSTTQVAVGYSSLIEDNSPTQFIANPALLNDIEKMSAAINYSTPFQISELKSYGSYFVVPTDLYFIGAGASSYGNDLYRESTLTFAIGTGLGDNFHWGIEANFRELSIKNYGSTKSTGFSASVIYRLSDTVYWSLILHNLNTPKIGSSRELLPQTIITGINISPGEDISTVLEIEKDLEFESRFKFGVLWRPGTLYSVGAGFINHPAQITGGFALHYKNQKVSFAIATHPELSISQVFTLQFTFH